LLNTHQQKYQDVFTSFFAFLTYKLRISWKIDNVMIRLKLVVPFIIKLDFNK